ncbi:mandelate racemase/muconate lactonizing enzyme family protein [Psychromarinibacter halotolerans]|uniref:Mandelate racemase/muconate lactonizing enzyme family protein n=1 Tax=Psychromarinibacter halotolerans TaxID=1775175 RepID=A0ABV7GRR7_9RHOB|nr:mandelate racemase/muconate lactonizing enzyme family protein [Psychromarinibacter halotolerans]MDF0597275.1 mandelate racemase/muconate lactonizing enzyme family protein [Psychromarinibacter halotolerans]
MTTTGPLKITGLRSYMSADRDRPRVLVALDTDAGVTGWGECYNHGPDRALPPLLDYLYLQIEGEDATRIERLILKLLQQSRFPPGAMGLAAISAIDHALWDLNAKALGVPVYQLLGGHVRDRVRVYLGVYSAPEPEDIRDFCAAKNEEYGLTAFKLSPYRNDIHAEPWGKVLKATGDWVEKTAALCPDFEFAYDAHAKLWEPWQAAQLGDVLAPHHPLFYEEPMRPENIDAWGALKRQLKVPLATGESLYNRWEFLRLLQAGGADIVQPDICVVGGLYEMRKIATLAEAFYVNVAPHNPMGPLATAVNLHFSAACPNFKILEYRLPHGAAYTGHGLSDSDENAAYVKDPYLPVDGHLELRPDRPGWGVEIDEDYLKTDRYVHWERKLPTRPDGSIAFP